ncbi:transcriptional regulator [Thermoproteota archaeon]
MASKKILSPQSVEVHYILPAVRRELAMDLKEMGLGQKEIAKKLSVTEAAVSQYVNDKRACKVDFTASVKEEIMKSAERLKKDSVLVAETQTLLKMIKSERITCKVCNKEGNMPDSCEVCFKCGYI